SRTRVRSEPVEGQGGAKAPLSDEWLRITYNLQSPISDATDNGQLTRDNRQSAIWSASMSDHTLLPLPANVRLIDLLHLGRPHVIGSYVLLGDQPALVDPGPASTLDTLEAGLAAHGLALADIQSILLTHIHLD